VRFLCSLTLLIFLHWSQLDSVQRLCLSTFFLLSSSHHLHLIQVLSPSASFFRPWFLIVMAVSTADSFTANSTMKSLETFLTRLKSRAPYYVLLMHMIKGHIQKQISLFSILLPSFLFRHTSHEQPLSLDLNISIQGTSPYIQPYSSYSWTIMLIKFLQSTIHSFQSTAMLVMLRIVDTDSLA